MKDGLNRAVTLRQNRKQRAKEPLTLPSPRLFLMAVGPEMSTQPTGPKLLTNIACFPKDSSDEMLSTGDERCFLGSGFVGLKFYGISVTLSPSGYTADFTKPLNRFQSQKEDSLRKRTTPALFKPAFIP